MDSQKKVPHVIAVVSPVFDDWDTYYRLAEEIDRLGGDESWSIHLFAVDDGSKEAAQLPAGGLNLRSRVSRLEVIRLASNLGHQRAIAVGLSEILDRESYAAVAVMDADGEDNPVELATLIQSHLQDPGRILVAVRTRRTERWWFRFSYAAYKLLFRLLVGVRVDFGNFCLIPFSQLSRIAYDSNTWNHLAATILRSKAPLKRVPTERGNRFSGASKMRLESLIVHGLSAISVFAETVLARVILVFTLLGTLAFIGIVTVVAIRLFTTLAIPGWATATVGLLMVIALQALIIAGVAAFTLLNQRGRSILIPATEALKYIRSREVLFSRDED